MSTVGLETYEFKDKVAKDKSTYKLFDLGGSGRFRSLWEIYASDATHIIIVIDSTDKGRIFVIRDEIQTMITKIKRANQKILILANKSDLPNAVTHDKIVNACKFDGVLREFQIRGLNCSALQDTEIEAVVDFVKSK
ncbi:ADP-ribosylation_factor like protein 2b [Hexamita inflata]|uniref:ADP-ribosylation factor like protein 2b n=1 Tax=Hexamita inflata TaxID=28002 RepID=A0AA86UDF3_9EUKA|nr:ADP-ribosylation factor like protein 2b [Hexamita inflata]